MRLSFDSIDEIKEFVKQLKGTRGGKSTDDSDGSTAPAPLAPPTGLGSTNFPGSGGAAFVPPAGGAAPQGGAFPAAGVPVLAPEVLALVNRINTRVDGAIASGQPMDQMLAWFRGECQKAGVDAGSYTMDQIKTVALPKMQLPALENIAKLMNA